MIDPPTDRLRIEGVPELWLQLPDLDYPDSVSYRPAVLIECALNFRSLRAGLNHSEENNYTAWLPEGGLAIDWDAPAARFDEDARLASRPDLSIPYTTGAYDATEKTFEQYQEELVERLVRNTRLRIFFNPVFGLFSGPGDALEDFLGRVAEAALRRVEPELKQLRRRFELQLEQIREAQSRKGLIAEGLNVDRLLLRNLHLFESENRITSIFSTLAGTVFGTAEPRHRPSSYEVDEPELREDLSRVEQEASEALRSLYDEYMSLANEYDIFEIGLQPDNIQVLGRNLLWVPQAG